MHQLEPNPDALRQPTDEDLARLREQHSDVGKALHVCITCRGAKQFRWRLDGDEVDFECDCDRQLDLHLWLLNSGIDLRYQRLAWDDATAVDPKVVGVIMDYAEHASSYAGSGIGLVMHGLRGNGKTMIAALLLKRLLAVGFDGYFTTFQGLLDLYAAGWGKHSEEERAWFDRRVRNAGVLVVDDMGREYEGRLKIAEAAFDHVLRARVASDRPTIITSNKTIKEMGELYSLNALSLLDECSIVVPFGGEDYRPTQKSLRIQEARLGLTRPVVIA